MSGQQCMVRCNNNNAIVAGKSLRNNTAKVIIDSESQSRYLQVRDHAVTADRFRVEQKIVMEAF